MELVCMLCGHSMIAGALLMGKKRAAIVMHCERERVCGILPESPFARCQLNSLWLPIDSRKADL
jgi:hypothetical protein